MILFHMTPRRHLLPILTQGLKPYTGHSSFVSDVSFYKGDQPIFLTDEPDFIISTQLTPDWVIEHRPVLLEVNVYGFKVQPKMTTCYHETRNHSIPHEFVVYEPIPVPRLVVKEDVRWKDSYNESICGFRRRQVPVSYCSQR